MNLNEIKQDKKYWQRLLRLSGYYTGAIDGILGAKSKQAELTWNEDVKTGKQMFGVFDARTESNLETLIPQAQYEARKWLEKAVSYAKEKGYLLKVICGTRSYAEQDGLYAQGRTKSGNVVTNAKGGYSNHNFGVAFDIGLFSLDGKTYITDSKPYDLIGKNIELNGLLWGGNWQMHDSPHYQLAKFGDSTSKIRQIF